MFSLFLDEDSMHRALPRSLRAAGIDVLSVAEAGRRGLSDEEHLVLSTSQGRVLYSCNLSHFARLNRAWLRAGRHHAGIVVLKEQWTPIGTQIRALLRLASSRDADSMRDQIEFLANWQD